MDTKQKITAKAIVLFNKEGCVHVSMRTIATACDMSLSNLQHHFKTKEILLHAIIEEMSLVFDGASDFDGHVSLKLLLDMNALWLKFQKKYLFFFIEISSMLQQYPDIRKRFAEIKGKRMAEYNRLFNAYAKEGLFKPEPFPAFFSTQGELLWFMVNYYLSTQLDTGEKFNERKIEEGNKLAFNIIFPLLSEKGLMELMQLNQKLTP